MAQLVSARAGLGWLWAALFLLAGATTACNDGASLASSEGPPPADTTAPDTLPPPPDSLTPPPDTTPPPPPPDTTNPGPSLVCGSFQPQGDITTQGLPWGPTHIPPKAFGSVFTGTQISGIVIQGQSCLVPYLEAAQRAHLRVFINLTGNERAFRDGNGFSMAMWKARVDRFRGDNIQPYIDDGTILAHIVMDEPNDRNNWNGKVVTHEEIEEMARYSKEIWPTMPVYIRTLPAYLKGGSFPHLDALWFHYVERFGPIDQFIQTNFPATRALGLKIISGLNVLNGGSPQSGIPGKKQGKFAMSAAEIREWGGKLLAEPGQCGFLLWEWQDAYLQRSDIKAALDELAEKARNYPVESCAK